MPKNMGQNPLNRLAATPPITDYQVQTTFNANKNNFSATARALTNNTGVEVSAGFVASRIKRIAAKEALQKSGVKIAVSDN